jgi:hypothetical protein
MSGSLDLASGQEASAIAVFIIMRSNNSNEQTSFGYSGIHKYENSENLSVYVFQPPWL